MPVCPLKKSDVTLCFGRHNLVYRLETLKDRKFDFSYYEIMKTTFIEPPTFDRIKQAFSDNAILLGIILDKKLYSGPNIKERSRQTLIALDSSKNAIGKSWGLQPKTLLWLYESVVLPKFKKNYDEKFCI